MYTAEDVEKLQAGNGLLHNKLTEARSVIKGLVRAVEGRYPFNPPEEQKARKALADAKRFLAATSQKGDNG